MSDPLYGRFFQILFGPTDRCVLCRAGEPMPHVHVMAEVMAEGDAKEAEEEVREEVEAKAA